MYEVNDNSQTLYVNNYFYCYIWLKGLLYAECDLLMIAKFYVVLAKCSVFAKKKFNILI